MGSTMEQIENFDPKFLVVQFDDPNNPALSNQRAIVPMNCLLEENDHGATVLYAPPPYRKKTLENIQRIIWESEPIPKTWKTTKCQILYKFETIESASFFLQNPIEVLDNNTQDAELHHEGIFIVQKHEGTMKPQLDGESNDFEYTTQSENVLSMQNPIEISVRASNCSSEMRDDASGNTVTHVLQDSVRGLHHSLISWMDKQFKDMDKKLSSISQQLNDQGARITDLSGQVQNLTALLNDDSEIPISNEQFKETKEKVNEHGIRIVEVPKPVQNLPAVVNNKRSLAISSLTIDDMCSLFHCNFPLEELDDFLKFDQNLKNSEILKNSLLDFLRNRIVKKKTICKSMGAILKKFIKRNILRNYTATKKSGDKMIFCDTQFYKLIEGPMRYVYRDKDGNLLDETTVKKSVGSAINNSIDWDGGRCKRMKHSPVDEQAMEHNYNSKCT